MRKNNNTNPFIESVVEARMYVYESCFLPSSPFQQRTVFQKAAVWIILATLNIAELVFGHKLYIQVDPLLESGLRKNTKSVLARLLKKKVVVRWTKQVRGWSGAPLWFVYIEINALTSRSHNIAIPRGFLKGIGVSDQNLDTAVIIAIAETVERICMALPPESGMRVATIADLKKMKLRYLWHSHLHLDGTVPEGIPFGWVEARDVFHSKKILVPTEYAFLSQPTDQSDENWFVNPSSNGASIHSTKNKALQGAILELIERDAFLGHWLNRLAPYKIDIETLSLEEKTFMRVLGNQDYTPYLFFLKNDFLVPVFVLMLIDERTGGVSFQASAHFEINLALKKVIEDTAHWIGIDVDKKCKLAYESYFTISDRRSQWNGGYMRGEIDFFTNGKILDLKELNQYVYEWPKKEKQKTKALFDALKQMNYHMYIYHYKNDIAQELGLCPLRVIIPELIPIYFLEKNMPIQNKRLYSFPELVGLPRSTELIVGELNQVPHPFL